MQDGSSPKQLIAEKIKQSANILVTVGANPSVDSLTAALGLTLMLNKLDKHATAVFSGVIPPAISFLEPNKTFENNIDSLRDFIIALDKDKADRLRYKVEDEVVRIFITPYRTKITDKDLQFSQGDFNVDLIVALGVEDQKDLDQAITAHGRILHDATVVTINAAAQKSSLGSIDWQNGKASSLSEMVASMAESLKAGILDQQISTALLTGIVASTERFSNQHTTPQVMTIAAQLMAAGANQQLIATKLQTIPAPVSPRKVNAASQTTESTKIKADTERQGADGEMHIQHGEQLEPPKELPQEEPAPQPIEPVAEPEPEFPIAPPAAQNFEDLKQAIQQETVHGTSNRQMALEPPTPGSQNINTEEAEEEDRPPKEGEESYLTTHPSWQGREIEPPSMGGTLNATAEQALEDKVREEEEQKRNHRILTHGAAGAPEQAPPVEQPQPPAPTPVPEPSPVEPAPVALPEPPAPVVEAQPEIPVVAPPLVVSEPIAPASPAPVPEQVTSAVPAAHEPTLEELEREAVHHATQTSSPQTLSELEAAARQGVSPGEMSVAAPTLAPQPIAPAPAEQPMPAQLPSLPPMPDFSTLPPVPGLSTTPTPSMPTLPELPPEPSAPAQPQSLEVPAPAPQPQQPPAPIDPTQFRIPGQ